jgi:hypothetical protein
MKKKMFIALCLAAIIAGSLSLGAYAGANLEEIKVYLNKGIHVNLNGESWQPKDSSGKTAYPITYNGTTYLPVKSIGDALGVGVGFDKASNTVLIGGSVNTDSIPATPSPKPTQQISLDGEKGVSKYLDEKYVKQSPVKTVLGDFPFTITVKENDDKSLAYDYLISFNIDLLDYYAKVGNSEKSIKNGDKGKEYAITAREEVKKFIGEIAKDLNAKLPGKKILGMSDSSYYKYPNLQMDLIVVQDFAWANYDFVEGTPAIYADYYSPLTTYEETVLSTPQWAPDK